MQIPPNPCSQVLSCTALKLPRVTALQSHKEQREIPEAKYEVQGKNYQRFIKQVISFTI